MTANRNSREGSKYDDQQLFDGVLRSTTLIALPLGNSIRHAKGADLWTRRLAKLIPPGTFGAVFYGIEFGPTANVFADIALLVLLISSRDIFQTSLAQEDSATKDLGMPTKTMIGLQNERHQVTLI